jgi:glycogen debranching enzyme
VPAAHPASCSPHAWAAAAPLLWLRSILRLDVGKSGSRLWINPHLPPGMDGSGSTGSRLRKVS